eukprot:gene14654-16172_t
MEEEQEMEMEALQLELDSLLCEARLEKLVQLVNFLKIEETVEGKRKLNVIKIIRHTVENKLTEPNMNEIVFLRDCIVFMRDTPPPSPSASRLSDSEETSQRDEQAIANLEKQLLDLKTSHQEQLDNVMKALEEKKQSVKRPNIVNKDDKIEDSQVSKSDNTHAFSLRHEFKISGQVGEPGQLDKLTYVSLIHQIDSGVEKGYREREIVDAVIKCISPHSSLRNYVLTLPDRSLAKLRSILRVFFQEKTAADLYQGLVTNCQKPKETPQQFLLRAMDARNKVFFASTEEKSEEKSAEYSKQLVQNTFLKTVETGLRDETLITNLRPLLKKTGITDEELMHNVNELATTQAERKAKGHFSTFERQKSTMAHAAFADTARGAVVVVDIEIDFNNTGVGHANRGGVDRTANIVLTVEKSDIFVHNAKLNFNHRETRVGCFRRARSDR